jgi:hypothetical protein
MAQKLIQIRDINGYVTGTLNGITSSDLIYGVKLAASVEQHMTVPLGAQVAYISYSPSTTDVFINLTTTAAVYGGALGAVTSELIPPDGAYRTVTPGATLSLISDGTPYVMIQYFTVTPAQGLQG